MKKKKENRGGVRPGAGRPKGRKKVKIQFSLTVKVVNWIRKNKNMSKFVNDILENEMQKEQIRIDKILKSKRKKGDKIKKEKV